MIKTEIGKIRKIRFGFGGYQDAQIGVSFELGSDKAGWSVMDFWGYWSGERKDATQWSDEQRERALGQTVMRLATVLRQAERADVASLVGVPVEAKFTDGNRLESWRVLTEAI